MLRAFVGLKENAKMLEEIPPRIGWPLHCYSSQVCHMEDIQNMEQIILDADTCDGVAVKTIQ